jgi:hypothetical protein
MGGLGSGRRWYYGRNKTTSNYRSIDIRRWHRDSLLETSNSFTWQWIREGEVVSSIGVSIEIDRINLLYRHRSGDDDWIDLDYFVLTDWTSCHLGGKRPWFRCPERKCGRRVAILYSGNIFACRRCYRLAYPSQREKLDDRATRRAEKIRARLKWEPGILNFEGFKPKGMHWKTFNQLRGKHDDFVRLALSVAALRFGVLIESLY